MKNLTMIIILSLAGCGEAQQGTAKAQQTVQPEPPTSTITVETKNNSNAVVKDAFDKHMEEVGVNVNTATDEDIRNLILSR